MIPTLDITPFLQQMAEAIQAKLNEAKQFTVKNVESCQAYLQATSDAVYALEDTYGRILRFAKQCHTDEQMENLYNVIDEYLTGDQIHHKLLKAQAGLQACHEELKLNADSFLHFKSSKTKEDRKKTDDELSNLLQELSGYLEKLNSKFSGVTGVNTSSLLLIQEYLAKRLKKISIPYVDHSQLDKDLQQADTTWQPPSVDYYGILIGNEENALFLLASSTLQDRSNASLDFFMSKTQYLIEKLRIAFTKPF